MKILIKKYRLIILLVVALWLNVFTPLVFAQIDFSEEAPSEIEETVSPIPIESEPLVEELELIEDPSDFNHQVEAEEELGDTEVELEEKETIQLTLTSEFFLYTDTNHHLNADTQKLRILPDIQALNQAVKDAYPDLYISLSDFIDSELELELLSNGGRFLTAYQYSKGFSFNNMEDKVKENDRIKITLPSINVAQENTEYMISFIGQDLRVGAGEKAAETEESENSKKEEELDQDFASEEEKTESSEQINSESSATEGVLTDETDSENIFSRDQTVEKSIDTLNQTDKITINIENLLMVTPNNNNYNNGTQTITAKLNNATQAQVISLIQTEIKARSGQEITVPSNILSSSKMTLKNESSNTVIQTKNYAATTMGYIFDGLGRKIEPNSILSLTIQPIPFTVGGVTYMIEFLPVYPHNKPAQPTRILKFEKYPLTIEFEPIMLSFNTETTTKLKVNSNNQIVISDNDPSGQWTLKGEITTYLIHETKAHHLNASFFNGSRWLEIDPGQLTSWEVGSKSKDTFNTESKYQFELTDYQLQIDNLQEAETGNYNFQIKWTLETAPN